MKIRSDVQCLACGFVNYREYEEGEFPDTTTCDSCGARIDATTGAPSECQ